jgi:hypothetical protein
METARRVKDGENLDFPDLAQLAGLSNTTEITKFASEGIITLVQTESRLIFLV